MRWARFMLLVALAVALSVGYVGWDLARGNGVAARAGIHTRGGASLVGIRQSGAVVTRARGRASLTAARGPQILFRSMLTDETFGKLAVAPLRGLRTEWQIAPLKCDRVYFAAGRGICLAAGSAVAPIFTARIFGPDFSVRHELTLHGLPSRARVSADGRYAATTSFVYGHSYAAGAFSTETTLIDMATGTKIATLEQFSVTRGGERFKRRDFNFWGVTFARESDRFYATLASGGNTYLVVGSVRARTLRVLRTNVECPSLSPDGTRIAFKKAITGPGDWRLAVLDLRTMRERLLAEPEKVDDQVEWLDTNHVLYWRRNVVWVVPADGSGSPRQFVSNAASPVVVR
jgi:hypothetical protein